MTEKGVQLPQQGQPDAPAPEPPCIRHLRSDRPTRLSNTTCPYCSRDITKRTVRNLEHVIGRRFVPKGTMAGSWNLHLWACRTCNAEKAGLESDVSSVTLHQLDFSPVDGDEDGAFIRSEAARKGQVRSPVTGRFVAESRTSNTITGRIGPMDVAFNLVGPPQLEPDRTLKLAAMHVRGLAHLPFFDAVTRTGHPPTNIVLSVECLREDWGNPRALAFQKATTEWATTFVLPAAAHGFFRAAIRRRPGARPIWSWALEWNRAYRVMGFLGHDMEELKAESDALPNLAWDQRLLTSDPVRGRVEVRIRTEKPLNEAADRLFSHRE